MEQHGDMAIYLLYNDLYDMINEIEYKYDRRNVLNLAELVTVMVNAFIMFKGTYIDSLNYMIGNKLIPAISQSCLSKLIKKNSQIIDYLMNMISISESIDNEFITDTFPVKCCQTYRYSKVFPEDEYKVTMHQRMSSLLVLNHSLSLI